jgi:hypothetical protein
VLFSFYYDLTVVVILYFVRRFRKKERSVRGECDRDKAETVFIPCAQPSQRIDIWRGCILWIVGTDIICSLCIQCNEDKIKILFGLLAAKKTKEQYGAEKK